MLELLHPDVVVAVRPGHVVRGREAAQRLLAEDLGGRLYEPAAEVFRPLDERRVAVEGRIRWTDDERVLRDDPIVWALEFRDGLVYRSLGAHSVAEAEALLAVEANGRDAGG